MKNLGFFFSSEVGIWNCAGLLPVIANILKRIPFSWEGAKFADFSKLTALFAFLFFPGFSKNMQTAPLPVMLGTDCPHAGGWPSRSLAASSELSSAF